MNKIANTALHHPGLWTQVPQQNKPNWQFNDISTVTTTTQGQEELQQLAPKLAQLSNHGRWIVLINPPSIGYKQLLAQAGVRMDRVLLVHGKDDIETLWATEKALTSGTSSAVISWTSSLDDRDKRRLKLVAKSARALGIVLESAPKQSHQQSPIRYDLLHSSFISCH